MVSLMGHVYEGLAFLTLATWWMIHIFRDYIKIGGKGSFHTTISYPLRIRNKEIPIEICYKLVVPVIGFLMEFTNGGPALYDEEGNFRNVLGLQHMSIFCLFFTHAVLDLLRYFKVLYIEGLDYLTFSFSFVWYAIVFRVHIEYHYDDLARIVHTMAMVWSFASGICFLWEYRSSEKFVPCYCRALMVMGLGTWSIHTPFYLFSSDSYPGMDKNPLWERTSKENYQVLATLFGVHLCCNIILSVGMYLIVRRFMKSQDNRETIKFRKIPSGDAEQFDVKDRLLSDEEGGGRGGGADETLIQ